MRDDEEDDRGDSLEDALERFLQEKPADVEGFLRRFPEHAEELREMLPAMRELGAAARTLASGSLQEKLAALDLWKEARERIAAGQSVAESPAAKPPSRARRSDDFVSRVLARVETHGYPDGRFEPEGEIARGGQGAVLAVWDETLGRRLAMKVALTPAESGAAAGTPSDARSLGRFLEEARVTAQLDHPGIVPVHDLGLDPERRVYFTMKLVKGRDLRAIFGLVRDGEEGWTETRALNVLLKVCEAMSYAHSKGVIHRDLKPSNVMVGRFGEVYVMDWGLARVVGSEDRKDIRIQPELTGALHSPRHDSSDDLDSPLVTMDGDVVGTPAFMSPEQARGELEAMGPHSDVYAVGAMLYQLLTGQMPYVPYGARLSNRAVWALVQEGPPDPVHELSRRVPAELVAISERAMARDWRERYGDMSELAEDLRAFLEGRVVRAYETGALAELKKWIRRNRRLTGTIAAALVAVLALSVVYVRNLSVYAADLNASNLSLDQRNRSLRAQGLASASLDAAGADSMLSLLLASEAVRVDQTPETLAELHRAVSEVRERAIFELESVVFETAFSPRGDQFLTVATGRVTLWDVQGNRRARMAHDADIAVQPLFSSAGDWILTASLDGTARRWDLDGHELTRFEHGQPIWSATLSPDERHVLTGSADGVVKLWECEGRLVTEWKAHEAEVLDLALSPGGRLLVTGGADSHAALWSLEASRGSVTRVADLAGHTGSVTVARFSPRGDRILTVAGFTPRWLTPQSGGKAWLWDPTGARIATLDALAGGIEWAGFSPDGERILSFSQGGALQLWDAEGRLLASGASGTKSTMWPGGFVSAGDRMVGPASDGTVWLFDSSLQIRAGLLGHDYEVISAHFSPNGRHVLTGSMDKTARLWDAQPVELPEYRHGGNLLCAAYSPDGKLVVTASEGGPVRIWNTDGTLRSVLRGHEGYIRWAGFSPDGERVLTASGDKTARLWDLEGNELRVFPHEYSLLKGGFSSRGDRIVTCGRGSAVLVWDVEQVKPLCRIESGEAARHVAFLADDENILVASQTTAAIYSLDGRLEQAFGPHDNLVDWAEVSPAGDSVLTTAAGETSARLWSMEGKLLLELKGHDAGVFQASFSPDGKRVVTASSDRTARVWDLEGHTQSILRGHHGALTSAVFSPDGRRILTASLDGTARTWLADRGELLELAERRTIRDFTPLELARYSDLLELPGREARELVGRLRSELILKHRVIAHLEEAHELDERVREVALRMARPLKDLSAQDYNQTAWRVVRSPGSSAEMYAEALKLAEAACELEPESAAMRNTLAAALYRTGRFEDASKALARSMELDESGRQRADDLVFLAMTRFRLGELQEAHGALDEVRALLARQSSEEFAALLQEAEDLLGATETE